MVRRTFLHGLGWGLFSALVPSPAFARARTLPGAARARTLFAQLVDVARARAGQPPPAAGVPVDELRKLSYDDYRKIRFRPDRSLWRGDRLPFEVQLLHPGREFVRPVDVFIDDQRLPFDPSRFSYPAGLDPARFADVGYAGLRVHAPFKRPDYFDEFLVFLGASYFRAVGRKDGYGLSARCLAIDTGEAREEFPDITALHLIRPDRRDRSLHLIAEVRSARAEGAFHFEATPGDSTTLDIEAAVFLRAPVAVLGLAPLSSMFLFSEEQPGRFGDYRPEVHDSDGLLLRSASGEQIFRPLRNPDRTTVSSFALDQPRLIALLQRDRNPASYQDYESHYQLRPSAWIEPRAGFDKGAVRLLEIRTRLETDDNIAALFVPAAPGNEVRFAYRLSFGQAVPRGNAAAEVRALRSGIPGAGWRTDTGGGRIFVVDWAGGGTAGLAELETHVDVTGGTAFDVRTEKNAADGSWRSAFAVRPSAKDVEIRAFLRTRARALSETLAYLWQPGKEIPGR